MKRPLIQLTTMTLAAASILLSMPALAGKTLDGIRARGQLVCGVNTGVAGFSATDSKGRWNGLDVDICRAAAAAVLGDSERSSTSPSTPSSASPPCSRARSTCCRATPLSR